MHDTLWQRLFRGVRRLRQQPHWQEFAGPDWADRIMALAVTDRFHAKQGRSIGRLALELGGRRLVVYLKRHYRLPWWHCLLATLSAKRLPIFTSPPERRMTTSGLASRFSP